MICAKTHAHTNPLIIYYSVNAHVNFEKNILSGWLWKGIQCASIGRKTKSSSLQGDWECSKLIRQKCSAEVSCLEAPEEFLLSCSPVLSRVAEGHSHFRCARAYFPACALLAACWTPRKNSWQTARWLLWKYQCCAAGHICTCPAVTLLNESAPDRLDHVISWLLKSSLTASRLLVWWAETRTVWLFNRFFFFCTTFLHHGLFLQYFFLNFG